MSDSDTVRRTLFPVGDCAPPAERAYWTLRGQIAKLGVRSGQVLEEVELQAILGFDRTPIREALLRLTVEGLVVMYAHQGTFVARADS